MEKKLAERLAARAAAGELTNELEELPLSPPEPPSPSHEVDPPPDSGVRASFADAHPDDLSYSVYTVAELEARRQGRPPRMSMAFAPTVSVTAPSRWIDVGRAGVAVVRALWSVVRAPAPRPRLLDVCRLPLRVFHAELMAALRPLPWRRLAIGAGIALGSLLLFLFAVLTAAELTDDLKPTRSAMATRESAPQLLLDEPPPPALPAKADVVPKSTELGTAFEIDDEAPRVVAVRKPAPAARPAAGKKAQAKKKDVEVFIP